MQFSRTLPIGLLLLLMLLPCTHLALDQHARTQGVKNQGEGEGFVIYGDSRTQHAIHQQIVEGVVDARPKFVISTGDMVENGAEWADWETFKNITEPIRNTSMEYYPCVGNHERWNSGGKEYYSKVFNYSGHYSFTREGIHFVIVNLYEGYALNSSQYEWFKREINDETPTIVVMHEPHFRAGGHGGNEKVREYLIPLIEKYSVNAVFYGHSHIFGLRRERGSYYVVTGGGGAPLYAPVERNLEASLKKHHFTYLRIEEELLKAYVIGSNGTILYEFSIDLLSLDRPLSPLVLAGIGVGVAVIIAALGVYVFKKRATT